MTSSNTLLRIESAIHYGETGEAMRTDMEWWTKARVEVLRGKKNNQEGHNLLWVALIIPNLRLRAKLVTVQIQPIFSRNDSYIITFQVLEYSR